MNATFLRPAILVGLFCLLATGCARISGTTDVKADGSFTRTLVFRGDKPKARGQTGDVEMTFGPTLDKVVVLPRMEGWSISKKYDGNQLIATATKSFAAGETCVDDIMVKAEPNKPESVLGNTASVTKRPDGLLEYREVIRWRGKSRSDVMTPDMEMLTAFKAALPASVRDDSAGMEKMARVVMRDIWKLLFGPGDPIFGLLLAHQDYAEFRLQKALAISLRAGLDEGFGDKISDDEKRAVVATLMADVAGKVAGKADESKKPGSKNPLGEGDNSALVAMLLKVKLPGKVVETNGELNEATGEVVWPMYSEAPATGDVVLSAVCQP